MSIDPKFYHGAIAGARDSAEHRALVELQQQQRAEERQQQIALLTSPLSDPAERIQLWEKLHELRLPQSAAHRLVHVIAAQTDLSVEQVIEVQQRRAAPIAATLPASP